MRQRPLVVGYDLVSGLGTDLQTQLDRAARGESGIGKLTRFPVQEGFPVTVAGQVPDFDEQPFPFLAPDKMAHWTSPVFKHALLTVYRALQRSGIEITDDIAHRTAVTYSTAVGGLDAVLHADRKMMRDGKLPHPFVNPNSCVNMVAGKVSILTGAKGPITTSITACATGSSSIIAGAMFLQAGMADLAVCGAVDFPLVEPIVAGFASMNGAYRTRRSEVDEPPERASRPFSVDRRGFVVSEGAAAVVLATPDFARAHGLAASVELAGWAMTSDAHHFVAPSLPMVCRCMSQAIEHASVSPGDIDSINAHATSTKVGDQVEAQALNEVFGRPPPTTANKSMLGHAMGAGSALESVLAMESMLGSMVLPTLNYTHDPELELSCVVTETQRLHQELVLKNAFGFGGCNACLVLRQVAE